jgi:hypothetical protein
MTEGVANRRSCTIQWQEVRGDALRQGGMSIEQIGPILRELSDEF